MANRFNSIDGETLMNAPIEPISFVVDSLLSKGLHILAGAPKSGKSWLSLWLSVTVAKGDDVWNNRTKKGSTLYLCFEDSRLRIQNRLFAITEDAPPNAHFCEESVQLGDGLEERIEQFVLDKPDTVLIIIDTLQMIRKSTNDNSYAGDYADLTVLKKLADKLGIAILLIHHLRKQTDSDPFNRISGTTGLSGAVDSSFTLVEEKRGSGKAKLSCIGRDIEYREIELKRNEDNIWELISDSKDTPDMLLPDVVVLVSDFMQDKLEYKGTPAELAEIISSTEKKISERKISQILLQNSHELKARGIIFSRYRSNGKRMISLERQNNADIENSDDSAVSDDKFGSENIGTVDPIDPAPTNSPCVA